MGISSLFEFCRLAVGFYLPLYFKESLHFSGSQIGLLFGLASLTSLLTILPIGVGGDHLTPKGLAMSGLLLTLASYIILGSVGAAFIIVLILILTREMGQGLFTQSINALIYKGAKPAKKGAFFGNFQLWLAIGSGLGMIFGGWFLTDHTFPRLFGMMAIILAALLVCSIGFPETERIKVTLLHYQKEVFRPHVLLFLFIFFLFSLHFGAETTSYGLFLSEGLHLSRLQMGYYMATELIFLGGSALYWGRRIDRGSLPLKSVIFFGLLCSGLGHIGMTYPQPLFSVFFRALHGAGDGAMFLAMRLGIHRLFKVESVGGTSALITFATIVGAFVSALIFGPLGSRFGYEWPLILSGLTTILPYFLLKKSRHLIH